MRLLEPAKFLLANLDLLARVAIAVQGDKVFQQCQTQCQQLRKHLTLDQIDPLAIAGSSFDVLQKGLKLLLGLENGWVVTDVDHWASPSHIKNLVKILRESRQSEISDALSNPCFDLWLMLHFSDFPTGSTVLCDEIVKKIRKELGSYNQTRIYDLPFTMELVQLAIQRAKSNDPESQILQSRGSQVFQILEPLVYKGLIQVRRS